jgi:hypothetical protein
MVTHKGPNKHEFNEYGMKTGPKSNKTREKHAKTVANNQKSLNKRIKIERKH